MNQPPCIKCLLASYDPLGLYEGIKERLSQISADEKADDAQYRSRLDICSRCDSLNNGSCMICGCFVELRAARKALHCPDASRKW